MTPLAQDAAPTMATVSVSRSSPSSSVSPCSHPPSSPSSSSSSTNAKLFRPWRQALEEGRVEEREDHQEVRAAPSRRRRREGGARKGIKETARGKKSEDCGKKSATPDTASASGSRSAAERLRVPGSEVKETGADYSLSSLCGSSSHPPPAYPHPHHPPPPSHLLPSSSAFLHLTHPPHIPPHLDPLLLAEMTEAELERIGLLGCSVGDFAAACGASSASGLPHPSGSVANVKKQRPKKYRCPHCQVAFSNNGQLRGHVRIHTGERPFHCEYEGCGKAFTRNEELTRHRRIHSGQRPFACPLCEKRFGRKDHLKKHARTHAPPPSAQPYLLPHHSDPRFLLAAHGGGGAFTPSPQAFLLAGADPTGLAHSQRMMEMAALSGFPYLYGY